MAWHVMAPGHLQPSRWRPPDESPGVVSFSRLRCNANYILYIHKGFWVDDMSLKPSVYTLSLLALYMISSSNGHIFRVTGPLCGEFTGHRWIPLTKASVAELCCVLGSVSSINGWVNNREAGDLSRHRAHYDVYVRWYLIKSIETITMSI